jgi:predicted AlkP superfamily pyrophosphatase or phosphodiesterase
MTCIAPTVCEILGIPVPKQNEGTVIPEVVKEMGRQERVAVVVLDAFGISTWKRFEELTPNFNRLAEGHLLHVRSVLPSKTPVNFTTMVTGASSETHGIRDRLEPLEMDTIFHVLAASSLTTAAVGRAVGTVGMLLMKFAEFRCKAESNTDDEVAKLGVEVIRAKSPDYLILQYLDVDDTGHAHGLESDEIREAVSAADGHLGELLPHLAKHGYGLLVLADHGAHQEEGKATHGSALDEDSIVPLVWRTNAQLKEITA